METSKASGQTIAASRSLQEVMRKYPLFCFFFLAYAISWIVFIPYVLAEWGVLHGNFTVFYILHTYGPAVAAIIMTAILAGKAGLQDLRNRIRQVRAAWQWYLFILLGIPVLVILGVIILPGALVNAKSLTTSLLLGYPIYYVATIFGVGVGEEIGWRGFALPHMQPRYGPLWGTLLLGVLWSCWHLPDFLTASKGGGPGAGWTTFLTNFPIFTLAVVSLSVIMTWIYNHTGGKYFHRHSGACQCGRSGGKWFADALPSLEHDRLAPGASHQLWGASAVDHHPDTRSAGLSVKPGIAFAFGEG